MIIQASELKHKLKKLSPLKTETYWFDVDGILAQDSDAWGVVDGPKFGGTFSIAGRKLSSVVSRMSGQIEIVQQGNKLILTSAKARVELEIQPTKSKVLPEAPEKFFPLNAKNLKRALSIACSSASPAKSAAFGGVVQIRSLPLGLASDTPPGYRVAGTDSLVLTVVDTPEPVPFEFKTLLNLTAAGVVQLMDGDTFEIGETETSVCVKSDDTTVYASKPMQKYPDFSAHLAAQPTIKFGFKSQDLLSALRTVEPLMDESVDQGGVALHFGQSVLQCSSVGVGSTARDEAVCEQIDPDPVFDPQDVELRLSAKYLSGFLSRAGETAVFGYRTKDEPVRMESDGIIVMVKSMTVKEKK